MRKKRKTITFFVLGIFIFNILGCSSIQINDSQSNLEKDDFKINQPIKTEENSMNFFEYVKQKKHDITENIIALGLAITGTIVAFIFCPAKGNDFYHRFARASYMMGGFMAGFIFAEGIFYLKYIIEIEAKKDSKVKQNE
jgi:hypothetical protein